MRSIWSEIAMQEAERKGAQCATDGGESIKYYQQG
jgi:hypothetical protein